MTSFAQHIEFLELHHKLYMNCGNNNFLETIFLNKVRNYLETNPDIFDTVKSIIGENAAYSQAFFQSFFKKAFFEDSLNELILILKSKP